MNRALTMIALLVAGGALVSSIRNRGSQQDSLSLQAALERAAALAAEVGQLQENQQALLDSNRKLEERLAKLEGASATNSPASPADLGPLRQRLDELDARQDQLTQLTREIDKYGVIDAIEKELVDAYATVLDENRPLKERLAQVDKLKRYGHFDDRAVSSMMKLYSGTEDFNEKSGALQALAGVVRTPEFRDQILVGLNADIEAGNQAARFRYYAIEALEPMLPDPVVQQWLTHLAQHDPDYKIAARAGRPVGITPPEPPRAEKK